MQRTVDTALVCCGCMVELEVGDEYLQCMVETCGKLYHALCTNKTLDFEGKSTWVCPECCILRKKCGRNCEIPVGTPVMLRNVASRNRSATTIPPPGCSDEYASMLREMQVVRDQMNGLAEQLAGAVSAIAEYHVALTVCSKRFDIINERLEKLEPFPLCSCRFTESGQPVPDQKSTDKKQTAGNLAKPSTNKPIRSGDGPSRLATSASLSARSIGGNNTTQDSAIPFGDEQSAAGEWQEVRSRKKRFSSVRCTAGPDVTTLRAVEYRKYIHLWNMASGKEEVSAYLKTLCLGNTFTVEELKPKGEYKSYKIGVPQELYEKCISAEVWPENARVKAWLFRRPHTTGGFSAPSERRA